MAPAPKTNQSSVRRSGQPKIKGAARAKSGCYTCRIRRKKCDEQKSERGSCKTCDRLRLECLGYGVKRPEWLRESETVVNIRNRIKKFLASQGMIKGHSSPSSRDIEQELSFLSLRPSSSPDSETSTTLSIYHRSHSPEFYCGSPTQGESWCPYNSNYPLPSNQILPFLPEPSRTSIDLYNEPYSIEEELPGQTQSAPRITYWQPGTFYPIYNSDPSTDYYIEYVFDSQYLLANRRIKEIIHDSLQTHVASKKIVHILAELHYGRRRLPQRTDHVPPILHFLKCTGTGSLDDAMAVLHSVSVYLFNGGDGAWDECIEFAASHVDILLATTCYSFSNPLQQCDEKTAFVIKTAIWFDVLASITTGQQPRLRNAINRLFNPNRTHAQEVGDPLSDKHSMLSPMGCENEIVWAISEISSLAEWKQEQQARGYLSIPELVSRAATIQQCLDNPTFNQPCRDDLEMSSQHSASSIFRAAAQLYLATVVSGDYPLVPDVSSKAQRTYDAIYAIPAREQPPVVRSTVFAFFLCGCFLTDPVHQKFIKDMLLYQEQSAEIGNLNSIISLLDSIWAMSDPKHSQSIPWRNLLKERHILLV